MTTGAIRRAKLQSKCHHQQTNTQFFTDRMPFLSPNQQCQSTERKNITFHGLAHPKLTWGLPTLSLTTNSSWLLCGRVAMPLISPQMPVPQLCVKALRGKNAIANEMKKSTQRDANTARADCCKVRTPPARHKHTDRTDYNTPRRS